MGSRLDANSGKVRKRIDDHRFEDEGGEEYEASTFGGFSDYMRRKKLKLQNLDTEIRSQSNGNPAIFKGIVAHVNGYTQPSLNDLHRLIVSHGGGFLQYLDGKTVATHVIASNLTPKKKVEFAKYRIVKPAWVVDSVDAEKLLPWDAYRVVDEGVGQKLLGFANGRVVSEANTQRTGYRDQTENSWYTTQMRQVSDEASPFRPSPSIPDLTREDSPTAESDFRLLAPASTSLAGTDPSTECGSSKSEELGKLTGDVPPGQRILGPTQDESVPELGSISTKPCPSPAGNHVQPVEEDLTLVNPPHSRQYGALESRASIEEGEAAEYPQSLEPEKSLRLSNSVPPDGDVLTAEEHNARLLSDPHLAKSSTANPDFLKQYYRESRLHHLSTWKAELKAQLQAMANEQTGSQQARLKRAPGARRYVMHLDFDSFFAAVSLRKNPQLVEKPVVIAHGSGPGSEIASCNYPARKFGVKNGMWMKSALQLCPELKTLPYDYKAYEEASRHFYDAIIATDGTVQSVSIDEALVDISNQCIAAGGSDGKGISEGSIYREQAKADEIGHDLRTLVLEKTGCHVSVGIGNNILLAKVALRKAKPAGQHQIRPEEVLDFMADLSVQDLPGVAYSLGGKLEEIGVKLVRDIRSLTKERLVGALGPKTGARLWEYSRGIDKTEVGEQVVRKSVSAEVNWGIRFVTQQQADEFVQSLCDELSRRLLELGVKGTQMTMKIMRRAADAPLDPPKNLGHGKCETYNKSLVLGVATNDQAVLGKEAISVLRSFGFSPGELRGLGVQMQKLEPLKVTGRVFSSSLDSSQRRLQFKQPSSVPFQSAQRSPPPSLRSASTGPFSTPRKISRIEDHPDPIERSPTPERKTDSEPIRGAVPGARTGNLDISYKPLNITGTQFVLPSQIDPNVLAELPPDIRSRLAPKQKSIGDAFTKPHAPLRPRSRSRSHSPFPTVADLPNQSQLDPETLDALPEDVRDELLSFYRREPSNSESRGQPGLLTPQKPKHPTPTKKISLTPTKRQKPSVAPRGRGRPPKSRVKSTFTSTLTQCNFIAQPNRSNRPSSRPSSAAGFGAEAPKLKPNHENDNTNVAEGTLEISESFLSALPPDMRAEVIADQKRQRLRQRSGLDLSNRNRHNRTMTSAAAVTDGDATRAGRLQAQTRIRLLPTPPKPATPTFTSKKLHRLDDLRKAVGDWIDEFSTTHTSNEAKDGNEPHDTYAIAEPYPEDVDALASYLALVVSQEGDMDKAVSIVRWVEWKVGEVGNVGTEPFRVDHDHDRAEDEDEDEDEDRSGAEPVDKDVYGVNASDVSDSRSEDQNEDEDVDVDSQRPDPDRTRAKQRPNETKTNHAAAAVAVDDTPTTAASRWDWVLDRLKTAVRDAAVASDRGLPAQAGLEI